MSSELGVLVESPTTEVSCLVVDGGAIKIRRCGSGGTVRRNGMPYSKSWMDFLRRYGAGFPIHDTAGQEHMVSYWILGAQLLWNVLFD